MPTFRRTAPLCPALLSLVLTGCGPAAAPDVGRFLEPELAFTDRPPNADPDACYSTDVTPAVIESVVEQVLVSPEARDAAGRVTEAATYRTVTETRIVRDRREIWFETLCPDLVTPQFVASLQRALAARGLYAAGVTGEINAETRQAIRRFQEPEGLHSGVLSVAAAKRLGLAIYTREEALALRP